MADVDIRSLVNSVSWVWVVGLIIMDQLTTSCVTIAPRHEPVPIPVVFQPLFSACSPIDREASMRMTNRGVHVFSSSVVWSFETINKSEIQFNGPLGDTQLQIKRDETGWSVSGAGDLIVHEKPNGSLAIGGYDIPLKSDEIGCVLSGVWPSDWLNSLKVVDKGSASIELSGVDDMRRINVDISLLKPIDGFRSSDIKSCAVLTWGGFLGFFKRAATICRERKSGSVLMRLSGINEYIVEWVINDDQ